MAQKISAISYLALLLQGAALLRRDLLALVLRLGVALNLRQELLLLRVVLAPR
jgi:hypothetical protein